ncbi:MAG: hypothetical protein KatS3mg125_0632 [Lysobacterales bacterium]|jgi:hypothetical protein|nr:MAG: hypothetical protein KatS3mg125_0632 [Xanthomonadales bacterium]
MRANSLPLWWLPFLCAAIPFLATHLAWWLSLQAGYIPFCIPYLEGCTSISRAARHGLGNQLFRMFMLPCALLQALFWWSAAAWVHGQTAKRAGALAIAALGSGSALALAVYATFLGTEGEAYEWMRRYGINFYFGLGFIAQLLLIRQLPALGAAGLSPPAVGLSLGMLALGLGNLIARYTVSDRALRDAIENALEWNLGVLLTGWFLLAAWAYARAGLSLSLGLRAGSAARAHPRPRNRPPAPPPG